MITSAGSESIRKTSGKNETTKQLNQDTGWTLDHFYVAKLLKMVRDHHPKPGQYR